MRIRQSFDEIKNGFHSTFWMANGMELFERLAYYGQATVLSIFLRDHLHFTEFQVGADFVGIRRVDLYPPDFCRNDS